MDRSKVFGLIIMIAVLAFGVMYGINSCQSADAKKKAQTELDSANAALKKGAKVIDTTLDQQHNNTTAINTNVANTKTSATKIKTAIDHQTKCIKEIKKSLEVSIISHGFTEVS